MKITSRQYGISRRGFLKLGLGGVALTALSTLGACGSRRSLRVAVQPWCGYQFLFLAKNEGWLSEEHVTLIETKSNFESIAALKNGQADAAPLTLDEVLYQRDQGFQLSVIAVLDVSAGADVLLVHPEISSLAQLKGKRIGVENTALGALMLGKTLEAAHLERSEVTIVKMEENHMAAWKRGGLDAILTYEPFLSELEAGGLIKLLDSRQLPQIIVDVLAVPTPLMRRYENQLRTLLKAHFNAVNLWLTNPIYAQYYLSERLGVKPEEVSKIFSGLDLPDLTYNKRYLTPPTLQIEETVQQIAEILKLEGMLKKSPDSKDLFISDFLPDGLS